MTSILVVAPHPDDETLGCGGTLLKCRDQGDEIHWLVVTAMCAELGFTPAAMERRQGQIAEVARRYGFASVHQLGYPTTRLDTLPLGDLVGRMAAVVAETRPETMMLPYPGDPHSDHGVVFRACSATSKVFRHPHVRRVLAYETLSETDFSLDPDANGFRPNLFSAIAPWLEEKIAILRVFEEELGEFPFPRSERAVRAQAALRGVAAGAEAAEAFMILKEIW